MKRTLVLCVLLVGAGLLPVARADDSAVEIFAVEMLTRLAAVEEPCPKHIRERLGPGYRVLCGEYDSNFEIFKSMWDLKMERPKMRDKPTPEGPWQGLGDEMHTRNYVINETAFSVSFLGTDEEHRSIVFLWEERP
jgi:hypothetical protein